MDAATSAEVARLEGEMRRQLAGRIGGLRVTVREDGLVPQGLALSHHAKQIAQQMAMEGTRLSLLANEIEVIGTATPVPGANGGRIP